MDQCSFTCLRDTVIGINAGRSCNALKKNYYDELFWIIYFNETIFKFKWCLSIVKIQFLNWLLHFIPKALTYLPITVIFSLPSCRLDQESCSFRSFEGICCSCNILLLYRVSDWQCGMMCQSGCAILVDEVLRPRVKPNLLLVHLWCWNLRSWVTV